MKAKIKVEKEVELKTLVVKAGVRYWEDAQVNEVADVDGDMIPCRKGDLWCPIIDLDSGVILNWKKGVKASIHYKVCDNGSYSLHDADGEKVLEIENDYVPTIMCPEKNGYGDYIIMEIDEKGQILNWEADIDDFMNED